MVENSTFLSFFEKTQNFSDATASKIDAEVRAIIEKCYADAQHYIAENRGVLDRCAALLLEKEKIGREEFEALFTEQGIEQGTEQGTEV